MYTAVLTFQHNSANFDELVIRFVRTLEVFTVCHTCGDTFWPRTKIQGVIHLRAFVSAVQTEQPSTADTSITRVTPCIPTTSVNMEAIVLRLWDSRMHPGIRTFAVDLGAIKTSIGRCQTLYGHTEL